MKRKTIIIIAVVAVAVIVIFIIWSRAKNRRLQEQMRRQQQQQSAIASGTSQFGTTIENVGGLVDSLTGLFGQLGIGSGSGRNRPGAAEQNAASTDPSVAHQVQCDELWPNPSQQEEYENCLNCYPNLC